MAVCTLEVSRQVSFRVDLRRAKSLANHMVSAYLPAAARDGVSLSLAFVGDAAIRRMNREHRGKDYATDVLSFSFLPLPKRKRLADDRAPRPVIGELIISVDTLRRQAKEAGNTLSQEFLVLFVHGLLHILGYDHENAADLKAMMQQERRWLGDKAGLIGRSLAESKKGSRSNQRKP